MAERTVNVRINYVVNTDDVKKAQVASAAAQKATDDLRRATVEYGKASAQAGKASSDALKKTQQDVSSLTKDFNGLYTSIRTIIAASLAREFIDISLSAAKLSGTIDGVSRAFNRLPNATLLMNDLRKATHGTVTDLELMQRALMASNFRIPLEKLGILLEFAAVKAQQTGQEVNHLINYIVSGIGYRSIKRLDDLGFTANRVKEALGGVSLQAASMGEVMTAVTTLMNEDLQKTGGYAETSATAVEKLETKWAKLKATVSEAVTSPALLRFYDKALNFLQFTADGAFGGYGSNVGREAKSMGVREAERSKERLLTKEILADKQKTFDVIQQEANTLQQNIGRNNDELKVLRAKRDEITNSGRHLTYQEDAQADAISEQIEYYKFKNIVLQESIRVLNEYNASLSLGTNEAIAQLGIIEQLKAEIEAINDEIETTSDRGDLGVGGVLIKKRDELQKRLDDLLGKAKNATKKSANEVQEYLSNLSDLELFQSKKMLEDRKKAREDEAKREEENAERSANLQEYFRQLRMKKEQEEYDESIQMAEDAAEQKARIQETLFFSAINLTENLVQAELQREVDAYDVRIRNARDFFDEQILLAGDNERAKKELRIKADREIAELEKQRADREKRAAQAGILVNTALGIIKAYATAVTVYDGAIQAAIVAAQGAAQFAVANRARYYAKGGINIDGPGTGTSDDIPAFLSKGESVITADATKKSMGLLQLVQTNKIDDRILKAIDFNGGARGNFSDSRIVSELESVKSELKRLRPVDIISEGGILYRSYQLNNGSKKRVRAKVI